jgi:hypothetical protein
MRCQWPARSLEIPNSRVVEKKVVPRRRVRARAMCCRDVWDGPTGSYHRGSAGLELERLGPPGRRGPPLLSLGIGRERRTGAFLGASEHRGVLGTFDAGVKHAGPIGRAFFILAMTSNKAWPSERSTRSSRQAVEAAEHQGVRCAVYGASMRKLSVVSGYLCRSAACFREPADKAAAGGQRFVLSAKVVGHHELECRVEMA